MAKLNIKELPIEDRPYEKFEKMGAEHLTDAELLAIIIKDGSKKLNCIDIARTILAKHENGLSGFNYLKEASLSELMQVSGIGKVKATQLKSVLEIAKRVNSINNEKLKVTCTKDVYDILAPQMKDKKVEEVRVIILDNKCYVKSIPLVSVGTTNSSTVSPKIIFSEPIKQLATSIIIVHNHPSGDTTPSRQDIVLTRKLCEYARMFDMEILDHVIIGKDGYTSIKNTNSEIF